MNNYALRINENIITLDKIKTFLNEIECTAIISLEISEGGHKHYQGVLFTELEQKTVRNRLRKYIPPVKNTYSLKNVRKLQEYLQYIAKDDNCKINTTIYDYKELHKKYWEVNEEIKSKKFDIIKEIQDRELHTKIEINKYFHEQEYEIYAIILQVFDECKKNIPNKYEINRYALRVYNHFTKDEKDYLTQAYHLYFR